MRQNSLQGCQQVVRALRQELHGADDQKVTRITKVLDESDDPMMNELLLDPFRDRLAVLKPVRPLRFSRFLFMPFDPLIVPARDWKLGEPSIPRTVLTPISRSVRAALGNAASVFDQCTVGPKADVEQAISLAGDLIWPRAAELLGTAPIPADWDATGLASSAYPTLARAIAAVLHRAPHMRRLARDRRPRTPEADDQAVDDILRDIANEPAEGRTMITQLILLHAPHAASALRRFQSSHRDQADGQSLQQALTHGTERVLAAMEGELGFTKDISHASLAGAANEVRRISAILQEIECGSGSGKDQQRLRAIRRQLDLVCQTRFAAGLQAGLVVPLAEAPGPIDAASQVRLEDCSRDLRMLETEARKVGGASSYEHLLRQASDNVLAAGQAGSLSSARKLRLIELLAGPDAAEALYRLERTV